MPLEPAAAPSNENSNISKFSPLNILGNVVSLLRDRFAPGNPSQWQANLDENIQSQTTQHLFIKTYLDTSSDTENVYPRLVVSRGSIVTSRVAVGDVDQANYYVMDKKYTRYMCGGEVDISIVCTCETMMEAELLGAAVHATILMTRSAFTRAYAYKDIPAVILQAANPSQKDQNKYETRIQFRLTYEYQWGILEVAVPLAQIRLSNLSEDGLQYDPLIVTQDTT